MTKLNCSVFIITKNEQEHIARAIKSCAEFSEVIVVDSGSTDKTIAIAKSLGAKVIFNEWPGYAKQKQFAMLQCRNDWVLNLDADEELTPELIERFAKVIEQDDADYVRCYRNDRFIDRFFSDVIHKPNNHRLFKKQSAQYRVNDLVHEGPDFKGKELKINQAFNHYGYNEIETLTDKYNLYSSLRAEERFKKGKKSSPLKLFTIAFLTFIKVYFIQRYFLGGVRGFIYAQQSAYYAFMKEAKLFEQHKKNLSDQEND